MDALEMSLLFDFYGGMLTEKQQECFDMRYNQDLSLAEIAEQEGISRQSVHDAISRAETLLRETEQAVGCVARSQELRRVLSQIEAAARPLAAHEDAAVRQRAEVILGLVRKGVAYGI